MITRTVSELAQLCGATLEGDGEGRIVGPASLAEATAEQVSFLANERYAAEFERTRAGAVLVHHGLDCPRSDLTLLRCEDPSSAFTRVIELFQACVAAVEAGVHPSAVLEEGARIGEGASVGALCYVGRDAVLGEGAVLHAGVSLGADCRIGAGSVIHSGVVLYPRVEIGRDCIVHGGTVLGSDGFGFEPVDGGWRKIPQCGSVVLEDDVEIGANCTVDRGRFGATRILRGTKVDNLVQVGHNTSVGPDACIVAQVGISGSSRVGRGVILAGQVGLSGHIEVGDGARVGGRAAVTKNLAPGGEYMGSPARPKGEYLRSMARVAKLPDLLRRVSELEKRLEKLDPAAPIPAEGTGAANTSPSDG